MKASLGLKGHFPLPDSTERDKVTKGSCRWKNRAVGRARASAVGRRLNAHLRAVAQVQVRALWVEGAGTAGVDVGLIERLQQPHEVGAVALRKHDTI